MSETRVPKVFIAFGRRASGKTIQTIDMIYDYVTNSPQRKALIFDVNDEFGKFKYKDGTIHQIKALYIKDIPAFSAQTFPEVRRIRNVWDNDVPMNTSDMNQVLGYLFKEYRDGLLLAEDINKYTGDNMKNDIVGALATIRQRGIDVVLHYQMIKKAGNPTLLGLANVFRLHKTQDNVSKHAEKFDDKAEMMMIAESIVNARYKWGVDNGINNNTGKYFNLIVDVDDNKIRGIFTEQEAKVAVLKFLNKDPSTLNLALRECNIYGEKKYKSKSEALTILSQELMDEYFCFNKKK